MPEIELRMVTWLELLPIPIHILTMALNAFPIKAFTVLSHAQLLLRVHGEVGGLFDNGLHLLLDLHVHTGQLLRGPATGLLLSCGLRYMETAQGCLGGVLGGHFLSCSLGLHLLT